VSYYLTDHLGSTRFLVDSSGNVTDSYLYEPYGLVSQRTGTTPNSYQFTGEQFDANTGMTYLRARWMANGLARFVTVDPHPGSIRHPLSLNDYSYALSSPVLQSDPSGLFAAGVIGAIGPSITSALGSIVAQNFLRSLGLAAGRSVAPIVAASVGAGLTFAVAKWGVPVWYATSLRYEAENKAAEYWISAQLAREVQKGRERNWIDYHHPIPKYLCGGGNQDPLVPVEAWKHTALHRAMVNYRNFVDGAYQRIFSYSSGARGGIAAMASQAPTRGVLATLIDTFYRAGWYEVIPNLEVRFIQERTQFVQSPPKSSCPFAN